MTPSLFTQSPIEASLWTYFVGLQQWIVDAFLSTAVFRAAVATWLAFMLIKAVWSMGANRTPAHAMARFVFLAVLSAMGFGLLSAKSSLPFRPVNAVGSSWSTSTKVKQTGKYEGLDISTNGLAFYVQIHRAANGISRLLSDRIAQAFGDSVHAKSPYHFVQTMAQTAGASIDDPAVVSSLQNLFDNCADTRTAPVFSPKSSIESMFNLSTEPCKNEYQRMRQSLFSWANGREGTSWGNVASIGLTKLGVRMGLADEETYRNKVIASALVNYVRARAGETNNQGVNTAALLQPGSRNPMDTMSTSYFVNLGHALSVGGFLNTFLRPLTGTNYRIADSRNEAAFLYSKLSQFLPPIRGYAKGILALSFVFAGAALCFGKTRFLVSWIGMLFLFTAYEPLSTLLYQSTLLFSNAQENVEAMQAIKNDPLVLAGAAIVDDNVASIQAVYFILQLGLTALCGWAGLKVFMFSNNLAHAGLGDAIVAKFGSAVRTLSMVARVRA